MVGSILYMVENIRKPSAFAYYAKGEGWVKKKINEEQ